MQIGSVKLKNNLILAPMAGVTDLPTRAIAIEQGAGMVCAEMLSGVGITRQDLNGFKKIEIDMNEHPISMQIFGGIPDVMAEAAKIVEARGADIVDINCGCPVKKITSQCAGSSLLREPELLKNVVKAVVKAVKVPVTVKIRLGWDDASINVVENAKAIEGEGAAMVAIHGRTRAQGYSPFAKWDYIRQAKEVVKIPVVASGDIFTPEDAKKCLEQTGVDGVLFARGFIGNPWIISRTKTFLETGRLPKEPTFEERVQMVLDHTARTIEFVKKFSDDPIRAERKAVIEMRKFNNNYIKGIPGAADMRQKINQAENFEALKQVFREFPVPLVMAI